jgi:hypothetical protein
VIPSTFKITSVGSKLHPAGGSIWKQISALMSNTDGRYQFFSNTTHREHAGSASCGKLKAKSSEMFKPTAKYFCVSIYNLFTGVMLNLDHTESIQI